MGREPGTSTLISKQSIIHLVEGNILFIESGIVSATCSLLGQIQILPNLMYMKLSHVIKVFETVPSAMLNK